jgi:glutamine---fructose-6-phosphate transaminase (isomerizing)
MCGVIGYVGPGANPQFFFNGLKRLEYRGYDSAGIAMLREKTVYVERAEGKLNNLEGKLARLPAKATVGIGHTRWATHGKPTENNAHPHRSGDIVLLHNGIIENYRPLKEMLLKKGFRFESETDTEVAAHLLNAEFCSLPKDLAPFDRMRKAIYNTISQLKGAFAFGILCTQTPDVLYVVRLGSPVVLGQGEGEFYMASGITALVEHTKKVMFLEDHEVAFLRADAVTLTDFQGHPVHRKFEKVDWSVSMMEKSGYRHFMLKEIHEQPQAIAQTFQGRMERESSRVSVKDLGLEKIPLAQIQRLQIIACGTSFYSGILAKYFIEKFARIPVEVDLASEYRYRTPTVDSSTLSLALSQSGETIDTLFAIKHARASGAYTAGVLNVPGSSIAAACHAESLIHAGPEIAVASTKAFSAQVANLILIGLAIAQERKTLNAAQISEAFEELVKVPSFVEHCLGLSEAVEKLANKYHTARSILFIGRGPQWAVALEGALKLKELSYIHAEAYAAGELKHGPIALIDEEMVVVCLAPQDEYYEKSLSNIEEIKARGGKILAIGTESDSDLMKISDDFVGVPKCSSLVLPFVTTVPMHLLAYWIAVRKGTDVDQPRNLAKSVTVE